MANRKPTPKPVRVNPSTGAATGTSSPRTARAIGAAASKAAKTAKVRTDQAVQATKAGLTGGYLPIKQSPKVMGKRPTKGNY